MAAELAEAGLRVVVLEEGPHLRTEDYGVDFSLMCSKLMRDGGGTAILGRAPIQYFEGRCVGGSTVVNGGMCWRTPEKILHRWGVERGLFGLTPKEMDRWFERVEKRINARLQDAGSLGGNNDAFARGCRDLGWAMVENVRNQVHCVGSNDCVTGCPTGAKQSTLQSYLPSVTLRGGMIVEGGRVRRILVERGRAVGVVAQIGGERRAPVFTVRAKVVVLACGATQTPLLLLDQGLCNRSKQVGRNFTIHPNIKVAALFPSPITSQRGTHQAYQCREFQDEGILLAPGGVPPAPLSLGFPGFGAEHAQWMLKHDHLATGGILVDDHGAGSVRRGPFGIPLLKYDVTDADQAKFLRGAALMAELYFAAGATHVFLPFHGRAPFRSPGELRTLFDRPPRVEDTEYFTAHLMGTCRMHADPQHGVVDEYNEAHDLPGLYISDASTLPGTLGVNPQETIMAFSTRAAHRIADRLSA
jgi:choline dehydrogenase-like flavoprotein